MANIKDPENNLILIADDDKTSCRLLQRVLMTEGYRVEVAFDGAEAIQKYVACQPNILLVDAIMPRFSGFDVCAFVKRLPPEKQAPVIMITGLDDPRDIDHAFAVGAIDYIAKPISWPILCQRLHQLLTA
jgi:PleD family two-component response regulator